jgi:hypothetical protein
MRKTTKAAPPPFVHKRTRQMSMGQMQCMAWLERWPFELGVC